MEKRNSIKPAHAPYNFIPLNEVVVPGQKRPDFTRYYKEDAGSGLRRFNGYIDCHLETITPLYIRDTYTTEELKKKDDDNKDNPDFFSPAGSIRIPGSSLRGMTRALVEIMSWGKFGFCDKKRRLFFRAVGDKSSLGIHYKYAIVDHIPDKLKEVGKEDVAEAIFGKISKECSFASRVFFEDAFLEPGQDEVYLFKQPRTPKILSNPKPTTFQHYLEQDPNSSPQNLNHWNTQGTNIRGHKLYWHRNVSDSDWQFKGNEKIKNTKLLTDIKPVKPHVKFHFRIRFENLSEVELGAILFALELPEGCYHKLGMGKPLGLGSVKITPTLFLVDRESRYQGLFEGDGWRLAMKQVEIRKFKDAFENYILKNIRNEEKSLWELDRMKQLKTMLDWNNTKLKGWLKETDYMNIDEFKNRSVLPRPQEVLEKLK